MIKLSGGIKMKYYKYKIGEYVKINEKAGVGYPDKVGCIGKISEYLDGVLYDYKVDFIGEDQGKFKEDELDFVYDHNKYSSKDIASIICLFIDEAKNNGDGTYNISDKLLKFIIKELINLKMETSNLNR